MKILIILLLIIIGACLVKSYLYESFSNQMNQHQYGNGEDYYPNQYVDRTCPCLSCIQQPCVSPNKS